MTTEIKRLIRVRVEKGATFKRDGFGKKRQLSDSWRKPRGQHNKQREQKKAKGALPKPGFGSPVAVRGMHPSGFFEVLVTSLKELEGLDPKTQAVRIGATVGTRKRVTIQEQAVSAGLKVLNAHVAKAPAKKAPTKKDVITPEIKQKKEAAKKPVTVKKAADKSKAEAAKAKPAAKAEEKKAPAAKKETAKPKAEKTEKSAGSAPKKTPAKKEAAKPKAGKAAAAEAKPKAAAKPKTAKSGVKKNE
jgi:large subunit ribosomal protein L32e